MLVTIFILLWIIPQEVFSSSAKPAARLGDGTAHGGSIIVGCSTVIIGGMPAARMTDMAVCTGPPDVIVSGCPTVLIGAGGADKPKKYSLKYIKSRYNKSVVITEQEFKKLKLKKDS